MQPTGSIKAMEDQPANLDWEADLAELLQELSNVQQELLDVLGEKREKMLHFDTEEITAIQSREEQLGQRLKDCHRRRQALLDRAGEHGLPADSIRQLASVVSDSGRGGIGKRIDEASARMRLLQHQSLTNWVLIQRTLLHLSQLVEIIATRGRLKPTYGKEESHHTRGSLVDEEA